MLTICRFFLRSLRWQTAWPRFAEDGKLVRDLTDTPDWNLTADKKAKQKPMETFLEWLPGVIWLLYQSGGGYWAVWGAGAWVRVGAPAPNPSLTSLLKSPCNSFTSTLDFQLPILMGQFDCLTLPSPHSIFSPVSSPCCHSLPATRHTS